MSRMQDLYTGSAGQAAVMSEFLIRGYNIAPPEVDRGDDLLVIHDISGEYQRIQVKTAIAKPLQRGGYAARFKVRLSQLERPQTPWLTYVLAVRHDNCWIDFLVIPRRDLYDQYKANGVGSETKDKRIVLYVSFRDSSVVCSKQSFQSYRNDFSAWPRIQH